MCSNLEVPPQMFNGIKVQAVTRPVHDFNDVVLEPFLGHYFAQYLR